MGHESMKRNQVRSERGSISPLIIGALLIGALLLGVIADSSRVFLAHRELVRLADSTALAAASALDVSVYYSRGATGIMPIDQDAASQIAQSWVAQTRTSGSQLQGLQLVALIVESGQVSVTLSGQVPGGFLYRIGRSQQVTLTASSSASSLRG
jgi:uncharacterized membrane protein